MEDQSLAQTERDSALEALVNVAGALVDFDRLRVVAALVLCPANRVELSEATGLGHKDLLRHLESLKESGLVQLQGPTAVAPDHYSLYSLNLQAFSAARKAIGQMRGQKPRSRDERERTLQVFMPGGKLNAFPLKQEQIVVILDEVAGKFEPTKEYKEREVNVILEDVNEDYCTLRRYLVDFGYLSRSNGVYIKNV